LLYANAFGESAKVHARNATGGYVIETRRLAAAGVCPSSVYLSYVSQFAGLLVKIRNTSAKTNRQTSRNKHSFVPASGPAQSVLVQVSYLLESVICDILIAICIYLI